MVHDEAWIPLRSALVSATLPVNLTSAITWPSNARADNEDKTLDNTGRMPLTSGQFITRRPAPGSLLLPLNPGLPYNPDFVAGHAVKTTVNPGGNTPLVLMSGYNQVANGAQTAANSASQFTIVYDISGVKVRSRVQSQSIALLNTCIGLRQQHAASTSWRGPCIG